MVKSMDWQSRDRGFDPLRNYIFLHFLNVIVNTKTAVARNGKHLEAPFWHVIVGLTWGHVLQVAELCGNSF